MPFALGFQIYPWVERLLRVRQNPLAAYGLALLLVAIAVVVRLLVAEHIGTQSPFITFYPAIIVAALIGGLWPGILATALSVLAAWYAFIPAFLHFSLDLRTVVQLLLFVSISGIDVAIAVLLNKLVERLVIQQRNIRLLLESAPNGFVLVDENGIVKLVNASAEKLFGYKRTELVGRAVETLVPEQQRLEHGNVRSVYQQKPEERPMGVGRDLSGRRKDGTEFPVEIGLNPVGRDGRPAVLATVMDISARKRAEENQRLIIGELKHRTGNLLGIMQAIISNTLRESKTVAEAASVLRGRVQALSNAYSLLADAAWEGASLTKILSAQSVLDSTRVTIDGCEINITPRAAQQFAMIIHELATNALKYGALSSPNGRISISGRLDGYDGSRSFLFSWQESGVPQVSPPTRKGFGSVILLDAAKQFGTVALDYLPDGLLYRLKLDLKEIEAPSSVVTLPSAPTQLPSSFGTRLGG
jgi:PAS domain S-box-containing protein